MLSKRWVFDDSVKIEIRLPFHRSWLKFWNTSGCNLSTQSFYSWVIGNLKLPFTFKIKLSVYIPHMETMLAATPVIYS